MMRPLRLILPPQEGEATSLTYEVLRTAQNDAAPGSDSGDGGATTGEGDGTSSEGAKPPGNQLFSTIVLFGGMFLLLWFFLLGPERRRRKEHQARLAALKEKDEVVTMGGIYGTILSLDEESVVLRVDEKRQTTLRISRSAVSSIVSREGES